MLLERDTLDATKLGVYLHPGLTINKMTYRGYLESADIQDAICDSFTTKRVDCKRNFEDTMDAFFDFQESIRDSRVGHEPGQEGRKVRKLIMWGILAFLLLS